MPHLYIVTGASRGMGLALARQLLQTGHTLLTLSRHPEPALEAEARSAGTPLEQWSADLSDGAAAAARLGAWLAGRGPEGWDSATLINNAGVIPPLAPLSRNTPWASTR